MPERPANPIFISYSRKDSEILRTIAFFLRDQGFKVWVDNEKLIPGTPTWEESIENAIKSSLALIVILSPDSKGSEWVRREITYADQFHKRVFPVLVRGSEDMSIPLRLVTRQYVDFRQGEEAGLNSLLAAILFYIEEKQTMEMPRPPKAQAQPSAATSAPEVSSPIKTAPFSSPWILPIGVLVLMCTLGLGMLWVGSRLFSFPLPVTGPTLVDSTSSAPVSTQEPSVVLVTTAPPPATSTSYAISESDKTSDFLNDVRIIKEDSFDDPTGPGWEFQVGAIQNGMLEIIGKENMGAVWRTREFADGEGILIDFRYRERATFITFLNSGSFNTKAYRRFGLYVENGTPITDIYEGSEYIWGGFSGNLSTVSDHTYTLLLAILPDGEILVSVWDPAAPDETLAYQNTFDDTWAGLSWTFLIQTQTGTIQFDNFREITFSGTK